MELALFDIDGTLVDTGGAGLRAIGRAAGALHGRPDLFAGMRFDGATDRAVVRAALGRLGRPFDATDIDALLQTYLRFLEEEVAAAAAYRVHRGAGALACALRSAGALVGLGTGNIEAGARIKLARGGLSEVFAFGGFGDDGEDRAEILRAGLRRGEQRLGRPAREVWVVGDTPKDLEAARRIGARVLLVATGRFTVAELRCLGPDLCVATLEDPGALALIERCRCAAW